nr:protein NRT1/ PTR FAMILY 5.5-like [Tanacetum cinerariifolium]
MSDESDIIFSIKIRCRGEGIPNYVLGTKQANSRHGSVNTSQDFKMGNLGRTYNGKLRYVNSKVHKYIYEEGGQRATENFKINALMHSFVRIAALIWADILVAYAMYVMMTYLTNVSKISTTHAAGLGLLAMSTPPVFGPYSDYKEECIGHSQKVLFYISVGMAGHLVSLIAVGMAGHLVLLKPFLNLQIQTKKEDKAEYDAKTHWQILGSIMVVIVGIAGGSCFDKAAIKLPEEQEPKRWNVCSVGEVEETKIGIRMLPMWLTFIMIGIVLSIGNTYFLEQANHMDRKLVKIKVSNPIFLLVYDYIRLGTIASVLSVYVVGKVSERNQKPIWFQYTLNRSRLDQYYWVLAVLSAANLVIYIIVATFHTYKDITENDKDEEIKASAIGVRIELPLSSVGSFHLTECIGQYGRISFEELYFGNKMHKAFPLPGESSHWQYKFPLPVKVVPTARRLETPLSGVCTAIEEMMKKLPVKDRWQLH